MATRSVTVERLSQIAPPSGPPDVHDIHATVVSAEAAADASGGDIIDRLADTSGELVRLARERRLDGHEPERAGFGSRLGAGEAPAPDRLCATTSLR